MDLGKRSEQDFTQLSPATSYGSYLHICAQMNIPCIKMMQVPYINYITLQKCCQTIVIILFYCYIIVIFTFISMTDFCKSVFGPSNEGQVVSAVTRPSSAFKLFPRIFISETYSHNQFQDIFQVMATIFVQRICEYCFFFNI